MHVAVLGGSSVASVQLAHALHDWPGGAQRRPPLDFFLNGRSVEKLRRVATRFADVSSTVATVRFTTETSEALDGADIVLVQVRIGGHSARQFDETFPWQGGLPGEETLGPGGFANCLRTIAGLEQYWAEISLRCPEALVLIVTNPAGIVRQAATAHGLGAVEVCDSPIAFLQELAARLDLPWQELAGRYLGMNHIGWYLPTNAQELDQLADGQVVPAEVVRAVGAVPLPYLRYYLTTDECFSAQRGQLTRAEQVRQIEEAALRNLAAGKTPDTEQRPAPWYRLGVLPVLDGVANGSSEPILLGFRNGNRAPWLPTEATVEGLARVRPGGHVEPLPLADPPPLAKSILSRHATFEELALHAADEPGRENLLAALLANPMVHTAQQAQSLADILLPTLRPR